MTTTSAVVDITLSGDFFPVNGSDVKLNISLNQDKYPTFEASFFDKHNNTYRYEVTGLNPQTRYTVFPVVQVMRIGGTDGVDIEEHLPCPFPDRGTSFETASGNECIVGRLGLQLAIYE